MTGRSCGHRSQGGADWQARPISAAALAVAVAAGALIALELLTAVHVTDARVRAVIETAILATALLTVGLLIATADSRRQLRELLLVLGVLALSIADFVYWAGPAVAAGGTAAPAGAVRGAVELVGAAAIAAAAFVRPTAAVRPLGGRARHAAALGLAVIVAAIVIAQVLAGHVSVAAPRAVGAASFGHSVGVGAALLSAALLAVAGLAFVARLRPVESGHELLAGASLLLAAAGVQLAVMPDVSADWVTPREGARLVGFVLLLGGAYLRYAHARRRRAYAAICSERERVARDLHDGLAQDLACISAQGQRVDCHLGPEHPLMLATRDALAEVRTMIADLTASTVATSEEAVQLVARELGRRLDLDVDVRTDVDGSSTVAAGPELRVRDDLIRSTREAITRAAARRDARLVDVAVMRRAGHVTVQVSREAPSVPETPLGEAAHKRRSRDASRSPSRRARRPRAL